jgi:protein ImuB
MNHATANGTPQVRRLVLWVPDAPVVAALAAADVPVQTVAAVFTANRVVACSASARARGVVRGMRRREAQVRCPELLVLQHNPDRDATFFETVAATVEQHAPGIQVVRPGLVAVPIAGAAFHAGGEATLAEQLVDHVAAAAGVEALAGVADGLFAAILAARRGVLVAPGRTREFLAPLPLAELTGAGTGRAELIDLLYRLGIRTFGMFAELPERDVANRFGHDGILAHRLARGLDEHPPSRRKPPPELAVEQAFDDPIDRVDAAAFAAKRLADLLHAQCAAQGLAITQLAITATTGTGQYYQRIWRSAEPLNAAAISDRVRWQLDSWLTNRSLDDRPTAGIDVLRLEPQETVGGGSLQMQLPAAGQAPDSDERAARALRRVQALLGPDSVVTAVPTGGRGPTERMTLIPFDDRRDTPADDKPWPGKLPAPAPATTPANPWPAHVYGSGGDPVGYTDRDFLTDVPAVVVVSDRPPRQVLSWAGPWPISLSGRAVGEGRHGVRIQVVLAESAPGVGETALLLLGRAIGDEALLWTVEGHYD